MKSSKLIRNNLPAFPDVFDFMDAPVPSGAALNIIMQDIMNRQAGKVAPDTIGVDYFFIEDFLTDEMIWDFPEIEKAFLKNCYSRLHDFEVQSFYGDNYVEDTSPAEAARKRVLTYMYNGAKSGDAYCIALIKYLFKTYHKKEYNQLRRFRKISAEEIMSLSEEEIGVPCDGRMARIMGMCTLMGIKMEDSCSILYLLLEKRRKEWMEEREDSFDDECFEKERYDACTEQVEQWCREEEKKNVRRRYQVYWDDEFFVEKALNHCGYPNDFHYRCGGASVGIRKQLIRTLDILKQIYPKKTFSFEEVQHYAHIYDLVEALTQACSRFDEEYKYFFGDESDFSREAKLFAPENILIQTTEKKLAGPEKKITSNVAPVKMENTKEEDYLAEISELRKKLHTQEQEIRHLREQNRAMRTIQKESELALEHYRNDREELIALREFAYRSADEIESVLDETVADMQKAIADKKIAIIGGHINWFNKLSRLFPEWMLIHNDTFKTVDGKMLDGMDRVYFFTDHISHSNYNKFIAAVREREIPFGYLRSINTEQVIRQIYEDMV